MLATAGVEGTGSSATSSGAASTQRPNGCLYAACTDQGEVPDMAVSNSSTDLQNAGKCCPKGVDAAPQRVLVCSLST